jgi:sialic acid synthase SpsE
VLREQIDIVGQSIGPGTKPYIIAEAGSNFAQDFNTAKNLIEVAAEAGADAVKFQLFRADALYPNHDGLYETFKEIELNPDWTFLLNQYAQDCGIIFLASAFDSMSVDVLEDVGVGAHKVASSEAANLPLLHYIAKKGRPLLISTGMCDMVDVHEAVNISKAAGNNQIALMQCGAMYPLPTELVNLRTISTLKHVFGCPVGFSDHTLGFASAITAVGLGATVFEKHFTLDKKMNGPDHFYALEPNELKDYIKMIHDGYLSLGTSVKEMLPDEKFHGRREGLYSSRQINPGERIEKKDLLVMRPAPEIRRRYQYLIEGASVKTPIEAGDPISWDTISLFRQD